MAENNYSVNFGEGNRDFTLIINDVEVITHHVTVPNKVALTVLFNTHGYGELMPGTENVYCATEASYKASFDAFVTISSTLKPIIRNPLNQPQA